MEDRSISDEQITASSQWNANQAAHHGRLHWLNAGGWVAATNDLSQWLQIDLGSLYTKTTRVATQGRNGQEQWVTKYKLKFSNDGVNFTYHREPGEADDKVKCFSCILKSITLDPPITATFVTARQLQQWDLTVLVIAICYTIIATNTQNNKKHFCKMSMGH